MSYVVQKLFSSTTKFLNQAHAGHRSVYACFLEIAFINKVGMHVCVCVCVFVCTYVATIINM